MTGVAARHGARFRKAWRAAASSLSFLPSLSPFAPVLLSRASSLSRATSTEHRELVAGGGGMVAVVFFFFTSPLCHHHHHHHHHHHRRPSTTAILSPLPLSFHFLSLSLSLSTLLSSLVRFSSFFLLFFPSLFSLLLFFLFSLSFFLSK